MIDLGTTGALLADLVHDADAEQLADLAGMFEAAKVRAVAALQSPPAPEATPPPGRRQRDGRILGVPANWVRDKARVGLLPVEQLGHYVRFNPVETLAAARRMSKSHDGESRRREIPKQDRGAKSPGVRVRGAA